MKILDIPQSGSVAGVTSSRNRYGQYRRTRAIPVNPSTGLQTTVRDNMATLSSGWEALSSVQKAGWEACAANFPKVDSLGSTIVLSGAAQYVRCNLARLNAGLSAISDVPPETPFSSSVIGASASAGTPTLSITFTPPSADQVLLIGASPQVSAGRFFWSDWRRLTVRDDATTSPFNALAAYTAKFGALIAGKAIFLRARTLNECGVIGPESVLRIVVAV